MNILFLTFINAFVTQSHRASIFIDIQQIGIYIYIYIYIYIPVYINHIFYRMSAEQIILEPNLILYYF